jgi:hypothetical protein
MCEKMCEPLRVRTLSPRQVGSNARRVPKRWAINFPFIRNVITYEHVDDNRYWQQLIENKEYMGPVPDNYFEWFGIEHALD